MNTVEITTLLTTWPIAQVSRIESMSGGTNNNVWLIHTVDEHEYVLRLVPEHDSLNRIQYEDRLLSALATQQLPFALPLLIKTRSDDIAFPSVWQEMPVWATLTHRLPGTLIDQAPLRHDLTLAQAAGTTLAILDKALAQLSASDFQEQMLPTFGDFAHWHPLIKDPLTALKQLPIDKTQLKQLRTQFGTIIESSPDLYAHLPQQLLHRDYDPANILVTDKQVTAVLDFEFAGIDIRIWDLSVALSWWPYNVMGTGQEWEIIDALGNAYTAQLSLSAIELAAIPDVLRLRDTASFVHRMGRYFAGLETDARIRDRVQDSFWREKWLTENQQQFRQHIASWQTN